MSIQIKGAKDDGNGLIVLRVDVDGHITAERVDTDSPDILPAPPSGGVATIVPGSGIAVDATDPANPVVSVTGGAGVQTVTASPLSGLSVDATDAANPVVGTSDTQNLDPLFVSTKGVRWGSGGRGSVDPGVRVMTAANLPSFAVTGAGVGMRITGTGNGALTVDGIAVVAGNRVAVNNAPGGAAGEARHGIFSVIAAGDGSNPYILERATDYDETREIHDGFALSVDEGTANGGKQFEVAVNYGNGSLDQGTSGVRISFNEISTSAGFLNQDGGAYFPGGVEIGGSLIFTGTAVGAAIADATDGPTAITQLNTLLAFLRTRGDIAP